MEHVDIKNTPLDTQFTHDQKTTVTGDVALAANFGGDRIKKLLETAPQILHINRKMQNHQKTTGHFCDRQTAAGWRRPPQNIGRRRAGRGVKI